MSSPGAADVVPCRAAVSPSSPAILPEKEPLLDRRRLIAVSWDGSKGKLGASWPPPIPPPLLLMLLMLLMLLLPASATSTEFAAVVAGNRTRRPAPMVLSAVPPVGISRTASGGRLLPGLSAAATWSRWTASAVWLCTELLLRGEVHALCPAEVDAEFEGPVFKGD